MHYPSHSVPCSVFHAPCSVRLDPCQIGMVEYEVRERRTTPSLLSD
jgi:hypothetical protein